MVTASFARYGLVVVALIAAPIVGCRGSSREASANDGGSGSSSGPVGSCTIQAGKTCFDYPGSAYTASSVKDACSRLPSGVHSATACATTNRVGSCQISVGQATEQSVRYYASGFTTQRAQINCTAQSGTFTPN